MLLLLIAKAAFASAGPEVICMEYQTLCRSKKCERSLTFSPLDVSTDSTDRVGLCFFISFTLEMAITTCKKKRAGQFWTLGYIWVMYLTDIFTQQAETPSDKIEKGFCCLDSLGKALKYHHAAIFWKDGSEV